MNFETERKIGLFGYFSTALFLCIAVAIMGGWKVALFLFGALVVMPLISAWLQRKLMQ